MLFNLLIILFIFFEIQKLIQFNFFFRLVCISIDYRKTILEKTKTVAYKELIKYSLINFVYLVTLIIGFFKSIGDTNLYYFSGIILLSLLHEMFIKHIKNTTIRKIIYIIDILLSILLLSLSLVNIYL